MLLLEYWRQANVSRKEVWITEYGYDCNLEPDDIQKLKESIPLVDAFFKEAHKVAEKRDHYSARTIVEVLRHNSVIEDSDKQFKINNHIVPLLSRISMQMFPALNNLFEIRGKQNGEG